MAKFAVSEVGGQAALYIHTRYVTDRIIPISLAVTFGNK